MGLEEKFYIGNLDARRDWGFAKDYVEGMWLMLQSQTPDDYVLATGKTTSVRDFITKSFTHVGIDIAWEGEKGSVNERGINASTGKVLVEVSPEFFRPAEVELLQGDPKKAKEKLGWEAKTSLDELCKMMVEEDLKELKK